ncbi:MAG: bifunctional diaminohydroxyphosphoribosylaminopyrimidine deaminase/5-amino-6-(5-phosphoribosylamino)uracil reductase RibD [Myxococcota bacterium]
MTQGWTDHEQWMRGALEQAACGLGRTHPNPAVGCVIVSGERVVARGFTQPVGHAHAEVMALKELASAQIDPATCTMYVTLEPCCVFGRTPPCSSAIIEAGIPHVVIGALDPDERMNGRGVKILRDHGVEVTCGVLADDCERSIEGFAKRVTLGVPWVTAKFAMTLDGKIASHTGASAWISSAASRRRVHEWRDVHDAVMVGYGTLVADDPRLTCRGVEGGRDPWRVVVDAQLKAPLGSRVYDPDTSTAPTVVLTGPDADAQAREVLSARGIRVAQVEADERGWLELEPALKALSDLGLTSVLVEGGGALLGGLFDGGLVDRVRAFVAPMILGGVEAPGPVMGAGFASPAEAVRLERVRTEIVDGDVLLVGDVPRTRRAFVAPEVILEEDA